MKKTQLVIRVTPDLKRKLKAFPEFSMSVVMESAGQHFFSKSGESQLTIIKQFRPRHDRQTNT